MLDSLYGDLPPSKEESSSSRTAAPKSTSLLGSLYDDLDDAPGDASPTGSPATAASAASSSSSSASSGSSAGASSAAAPSGASAWAAHRLQLLTPAVVRKQTLAAAAAKTMTSGTPSGAPASATPVAAAAGTAGGAATGTAGGSADGSAADNDSDKSSIAARSRSVGATAAAGNVGSFGKSGSNAAGGGSNTSKHSAIDVAAVAAAASAAAAAVAAQLKAVKSEAGLILSRGAAAAGAAAASAPAEAPVVAAGAAADGACAADVKEEEKAQASAAATVKAEQAGGAAAALADDQEPSKAAGSAGVAAAAAEEEEDKSGFIAIGSLPDEYDPSAPNDYISVYRERIRKQQREELERLRQQELEKQRRERELALGGPGVPPLSGVAFSEGPGGGAGPPGQAGAVPAAGAAVPAPPALPSYIDPAKKSFAARMMEKMGWKHGEGLGVNKQGITAPLVAKKTAMRSGVIVQGAEVVAAAAQARAAQFNRAPTRVLLLLNMVGRGEVDEDLKQETEEEAAKFGNLLQVRVVEAAEAPDEEAVRIFCEYERKEEATLAFLTMNGRVFGGRTVRSKFFCEDRWQKEDLLPNPEEEADKKIE